MSTQVSPRGGGHGVNGGIPNIDQQVMAMKEVLSRLMKHRHSWPFHDPVDADDVSMEKSKKTMIQGCLNGKIGGQRFQNSWQSVSFPTFFSLPSFVKANGHHKFVVCLKF